MGDFFNYSWVCLVFLQTFFSLSIFFNSLMKKAPPPVQGSSPAGSVRASGARMDGNARVRRWTDCCEFELCVVGAHSISSLGVFLEVYLAAHNLMYKLILWVNLHQNTEDTLCVPPPFEETEGARRADACVCAQAVCGDPSLSISKPARLDVRQRQEEDRQTVTVAEARPGWHWSLPERQRRNTQVASSRVGGGAVRQT